MFPNKTYELRKLYFEQSKYSAKPIKPEYPLLLQWPEKGYFKKLKPDVDLLQRALKPDKNIEEKSISEQIFGNEIKQQSIDLHHIANLFYERCRLHKNHISEIDRRHIEAQEKLFGVQINNASDKGKRLSTLEGQLSQLDQQRREEELAFWKDTVELRGTLFENSGDYRAAKQREFIFSDVEAGYGR
ncbi:hypothetical protein ACFL3G_01925 [Planctomycetota bacterium]